LVVRVRNQVKCNFGNNRGDRQEGKLPLGENEAFRGGLSKSNYWEDSRGQKFWASFRSNFWPYIQRFAKLEVGLIFYHLKFLGGDIQKFIGADHEKFGPEEPK
jgi:hypothetical protein